MPDREEMGVMFAVRPNLEMWTAQMFVSTKDNFSSVTLFHCGHLCREEYWNNAIKGQYLCCACIERKSKTLCSVCKAGT